MGHKAHKMGEDEALEWLKGVFAESHLSIAQTYVWFMYQEVYDAEVAEIRCQVDLEEAAKVDVEDDNDDDNEEDGQETADDDDQGAENTERVSDIPPSPTYQATFPCTLLPFALFYQLLLWLSFLCTLLNWLGNEISVYLILCLLFAMLFQLTYIFLNSLLIQASFV